VLQIATATGRSRHEVVGMLLEFWSWADSQTDDGDLPGISVAHLSSLLVTSDGTFWRAVEDAGWLVVETGGVRVPNFTVWMSCSAKKRLRQTRNKQKSRAVDGGRRPARHRGVTAEEDTAVTKRGTTEQNRTEKTPLPPQEGGEASGDRAQQPQAVPATPGPDTARTTAGDRPDLHADAVRLARLYDRMVGTSNLSNGRIATQELLNRGHRAEDVERSIRHYAEHVKREGVPQSKRKSCMLFCRDGLWETFLVPPAPPADASPSLGTVEPIEEVYERTQREIEARRAARKAAGADAQGGSR
jgi:hypothetical protein